jgi:predicted DsbA family dithiol-disulfide isomerase
MSKKSAFCLLGLFSLILVSHSATAEPILWNKIINADHKKLNTEQKKRVETNLNKIKNTRGCTETIAVCMSKGDMTARRHAGFVVRMVRKGKDDTAIEEGIKARHESAFPQETFDIDLSGHPYLGNPKAKVVIVEYACFECPFCAHIAPRLKDLGKKFGGNVVHYYKFFPVRSHKRGVAAALAGLAAHKQNKFWKMYDLMYSNRTDLEDDDLVKYAKQANLDIDKWQDTIKDSSTMRSIEKDKLEGMRFGVEGTPTFFVNGKNYTGATDYNEIIDRIAEELEIVEGKIR